MHICRQCIDAYMVNNIELLVAQTYSDLGVVASHDLKTTTHCSAIAAKSFRTLWILHGPFSYVDDKTFLTSYTLFLLSKLGYCEHVSSPCLKRNSELSEGVQRTAAKLISRITKQKYDTWLVRLNLFPLSYRRTTGDFTTVFKLISDQVASDMPSFFLSYKTENLRKHPRRNIQAHNKLPVTWLSTYPSNHQQMKFINSIRDWSSICRRFKSKLDQLWNNHYQNWYRPPSFLFFSKWNWFQLFTW